MTTRRARTHQSPLAVLASSPDTPVDLLAVLIEDEDNAIRFLVVQNPATPTVLLQAHAADPRFQESDDLFPSGVMAGIALTSRGHEPGLQQPSPARQPITDRWAVTPQPPKVPAAKLLR